MYPPVMTPEEEQQQQAPPRRRRPGGAQQQQAPLAADQEQALMGGGGAPPAPAAANVVDPSAVPPLLPRVSGAAAGPGPAPMPATPPPMTPIPGLPAGSATAEREGAAAYGRGASYMDPAALHEQAMRVMMASRATARMGRDGIINPDGPAPLNFAQLNGGMDYGQALALSQDQAARLMEHAGQAERFGLQRAGELGRLALERSRQGLERTLGLGRLGLDVSRAGTERELGLGRLGLDTTLGLGQLGLGQQRADTEALLGAGNLDVARQRAASERDLGMGQLGLGQRRQVMEEYRTGADMELDRSGQRLAATMAAQGRSPQEVRAALELWRRQFPQAGQPAPGFTPGAPFAPPGGMLGQPPSQGQPQAPPMPQGYAGPANYRPSAGPPPMPPAIPGPGSAPLPQQGPPMPGVAPQLAAQQPGRGQGPQAQQQQAPAPDDQRFRDVFGDQLHAELEGIRTGPAGQGRTPQERMMMAARLLAQHMNRPESAGRPEVGQAMLDYMRGHYGGEFDQFVRPTQTTLTNQAAGNFFRGEPSEEEVLSSQYRHLAGAAPREETVPNQILGTALRVTPVGMAYGLGRTLRSVREGPREGESRGGHLRRSLRDFLPF